MEKGGVCICHKEYISLISRDNINILDNCLVTEIRSRKEKCFLTCIYYFPSQNQDAFKNFYTNFNIINDKLPLCSIVTGDFDARCTRCWKNDITNLQGQHLDSLTLSVGYNQIIDEPTHVINNSMSSNDLIFCTNQSAILNHGFDVSVIDKNHQNIIYGKTNIRVPPSPTYVRKVLY